MKKNIVMILGMSIAMQSCSNTKVTGMKECVEQLPKEKKNTYTEFNPNPENSEYRKKYLGVKRKNFKK